MDTLPGAQLTAQTDEEIARLIQAGQFDLLAILMERYEAKMARYARKFLANSDDIKDVLQKIFLKTYVNIKSFDVKRRFSPWLYRIAHNELVNVLKERRKATLPLFDFDVFLPGFFSDNNLEQDLDDKKLFEAVNTSLGQIEAKYREPIILYYSEGLSYQEISDIIRIPVSTVGVRINRAKKLLKAHWQKIAQKYE